MESTGVTGSGRICIHSGNREHGPTAKRSRFLKDGLGRTTYLERRVALTLGFARNMRIFGKESFTASNKLANCSKLKSGTSHSVCFLSQHLGLLTSSAAKHPEILAIRYQLNLMELARKPKPRRQHRGQPCTNNTYNISRESRMTMTTAWTKDISSQLALSPADDICRVGESGVFDINHAL